MRASLTVAFLLCPILSCSSDEFTTTDASTDASSDLAVDAPSDAPVDGGARLCAAHPNATLCDDFDEPADGSGGFKPVYTFATSQGLLSRTNDSASPPFGLLATIQPDVKESTAMLGFDPNKASITRFSFAAKVKVDASCDTADGVTFLILGGLANSSSEYLAVGVGLAGDRSALLFYDAQSNSDGGSTIKLQGAASNALAFGAWFDFAAEFTFGVLTDAGKPQNVIALKWDNQTVYSGKAAGAASELGLASVSFGATGVRKTACTVHFDDIVLDMIK